MGDNRLDSGMLGLGNCSSRSSWVDCRMSFVRPGYAKLRRWPNRDPAGRTSTTRFIAMRTPAAAAGNLDAISRDWVDRLHSIFRNAQGSLRDTIPGSDGLWHIFHDSNQTSRSHRGALMINRLLCIHLGCIHCRAQSGRSLPGAGEYQG